MKCGYGECLDCFGSLYEDIINDDKFKSVPGDYDIAYKHLGSMSKRNIEKRWY